MLPLSKLLKPYRDAAAANSVLAPHRFVDQHCFLTKSGSLGLALSLEGIDTGCLTDDALEGIGSRLRSALGSFDDGFKIYQYVIKHDGELLPSSESYPSKAVGSSVRERTAAIASHGLYSVSLYIVLVYEPQGFGKRKLAASNKKVLRVLAQQLARDVERLKRKADSFVQETRDLLNARLLAKAEVFTFLRTLVNLDPEIAQAVPLCHDSHLDYFLPNHTVAVHRDGIQVGSEYLEVITLKDPPRSTRPDLFRELCSLRANFILCTEYKPVPKAEAVKMIANAESHFNRMQWLKTPWSMVTVVLNKFLGESDDRRDIVADKAALSDVDELGKVAVALNEGDTLGQFSTTIVLHGTNKGQLLDLTASVVKFFGKYEASTYQETYNALNAYLSIIPGNSAFNMRMQWMLGANYADMALVFATGRGEKRNNFLNAEYLLACETEDRTPYFLNLHHEDVFGVLVTGKTGSGKSVLSNACLDHLQKYDPITLILDVGGSYKNLCRRYDGSYMSLGRLDFRINPFTIPESDNGKRFLSAFVRMLLGNEGYRVTFEDTPNIFEAVCEIYTRPEEQRRLSNLKLAKHLWAPLQRWTAGGEYGSVFDNVEDTVTFSRLKVFDFQGIEEVPEIAEPLFFYLFMRHESMVQDPSLVRTFKVLWCDETWRFLQNETGRKQFIKAGKTYRKHNAGIGLATQSAFDLKNAGVLEIIGEVTPTKLLLANPSADIEAYRQIFHLNEKEVDKFRKLAAKRQFMLKREEQPAIVLDLNLSPMELLWYGNSPYENHRREEAISRYGFEEGLKAVAGGMK